MEKLGRDYVNAWVLINDLPRVAAEATDAHVRTLAERAEKNYTYPVDSQLYTPAGELIEHLNANQVLRGDAESCYTQFLEAPWRPAGASSDELAAKGKNKIKGGKGDSVGQKTPPR